MEYTEEQLAAIHAPEPKVLVVSTAGAGKTACLTERISYLCQRGVDPSKIAAITFTTNAAEEIRLRVGQIAQNAFIGTIHGLAYKWLMQAGVDVGNILNEDRFDLLFNLVKQNPQCVQQVDCLLLDEGQDSSAIQFEFLLGMIQPKEWTIFADWRQSIYQWNGAVPEYIIDLSQDPSVAVYELTRNFRCGHNIAAFAKTLIAPLGPQYADHSVPATDFMGKVETEIRFLPHNIAKVFKEKSAKELSQWFVLTRTNKMLNEMSEAFDEHHVPYCTFKQKNTSLQQTERLLRAPCVKLLTIHAAKGLESENVMVIGARHCNEEERCLAYVAATRAKRRLCWVRMTQKISRLYFDGNTENWEI